MHGIPSARQGVTRICLDGTTVRSLRPRPIPILLRNPAESGVRLDKAVVEREGLLGQLSSLRTGRHREQPGPTREELGQAGIRRRIGRVLGDGLFVIRLRLRGSFGAVVEEVRSAKKVSLVG